MASENTIDLIFANWNEDEKTALLDTQKALLAKWSKGGAAAKLEAEIALTEALNAFREILT